MSAGTVWRAICFEPSSAGTPHRRWFTLPNFLCFLMILFGIFQSDNSLSTARRARNKEVERPLPKCNQAPDHCHLQIHFSYCTSPTRSSVTRHANRELNLCHASRWPSECISERDIPILGRMICFFFFVGTCGPDIVNQVTHHEQSVNCELTAFQVSRVTTCELLVGEVQYSHRAYDVFETVSSTLRRDIYGVLCNSNHLFCSPR